MMNWLRIEVKSRFVRLVPEGATDTGSSSERGMRTICPRESSISMRDAVCGISRCACVSTGHGLREHIADNRERSCGQSLAQNPQTVAVSDGRAAAALFPFVPPRCAVFDLRLHWLRAELLEVCIPQAVELLAVRHEWGGEEWRRKGESGLQTEHSSNNRSVSDDVPLRFAAPAQISQQRVIHRSGTWTRVGTP